MTSPSPVDAKGSSFNAFGDNPIPVAPCKCGYQWREGALPEEICHRGGGEYIVVCPRCRADGELKATPKWAVDAWNEKRAPSPVDVSSLRERLRDYIYDCTKDGFGHGWTLSAEQADHVLAIASHNTEADALREALKACRHSQCCEAKACREKAEKLTLAALKAGA